MNERFISSVTQCLECRLNINWFYPTDNPHYFVVRFWFLAALIWRTFPLNQRFRCKGYSGWTQELNPLQWRGPSFTLPLCLMQNVFLASAEYEGARLKKKRALSCENYKPVTMRPNRFMGRCIWYHQLQVQNTTLFSVLLVTEASFTWQWKWRKHTKKWSIGANLNTLQGLFVISGLHLN